MTRRLISLLLAAVAAFGVASCGADKSDPVLLAETEGIYLDIDDLTYQVQLSRILNPSSPEDSAYLTGLPEGVGLESDEVWFAVFIRVQNETDEPRPTADTFEIVDTQETRFQPVVLDETNVFVYEPAELGPGALIPPLDSPSSDGPVQGSLLLFKVKIASLYNRPLEFHISKQGSETVGTVDLDV